MKAKKVLKILAISRVTLYKYVKNGIIKVTKMENGYYDYDNESVMKFIGKNERKNYIYARVSTYKQKPDLNNQIIEIKNFCNDKNISFDAVYFDISSGLDLNRPNFTKILDDIFSYNVNFLIINYTDRLTRLSFSILESVFKKFGTKIICVHKNDSNNDEYYNDLLTLMHTFSTKFYANRRKN